MTRIAIAGTGRMGTAFARRLIETGHAVTVWNRNPAKAEAAVAAGATLAPDLAALTSSDIILLSLTDAAAVTSVVDTLIGAGMAGSLVVDLSTLLPEDSRAIAGRVTAVGAEWLDCPVGGTVAPALKGQLLGMAGGTETAFARAKPVLDQLCRRVEHLGPTGAGSQMKLALNLPLAIYWQTLGESLALLQGSGIAADRAISLIADSSGGPTVLRNRAQVVVDTLNGADQAGTFDINGLIKDLDLALRQAATLGRRLALAETTRDSYAEAAGAGLGGCDGASLTRRVRG